MHRKSGVAVYVSICLIVLFRFGDCQECEDCGSSPPVSKPHATPCADDSYCFNHGSCYIISTLGLRFCQCDADFQGERCEEKRAPTGERREEVKDDDVLKRYFFLIVIGAVAGLLVIIAICILLTMAAWSRRKKSETSMSAASSVHSVKFQRVTTVEAAIDTENTSNETELQTIPSRAAPLRPSLHATTKHPQTTSPPDDAALLKPRPGTTTHNPQPPLVHWSSAGRHKNGGNSIRTSDKPTSGRARSGNRKQNGGRSDPRFEKMSVSASDEWYSVKPPANAVVLREPTKLDQSRGSRPDSTIWIKSKCYVEPGQVNGRDSDQESTAV